MVAVVLEVENDVRAKVVGTCIREFRTSED